MAFCVVYDTTVVGTILCYKSCRQPHQSFIWHYANSSVFFFLFFSPFSVSQYAPSFTFVTFFFPLTVARFSLIELYSHSNLLKSVLAVTSTIEVVGREAFKKKKRCIIEKYGRKVQRKTDATYKNPAFLLVFSICNPV